MSYVTCCNHHDPGLGTETDKLHALAIWHTVVATTTTQGWVLKQRAWRKDYNKITVATTTTQGWVLKQGCVLKLMTNSPIEINIPLPHPAQRRVLREARRFNVVCCGRRWGKTHLSITMALETALTTGLPVGWFAPTYRLLLEAWRELYELSMPVQKRVSSSEKRIELQRGIIEMWSLDRPGAGRSRKYAMVVVDEAAMVKDLRMQWNAAIRPTLADYSGSAWFLSTPTGYDYFYELWHRQDDQWVSWQMPTSSNPYINPLEIDAMRSELPERIAQQEIDAQFITDGSIFRNVNELATLDQQEPHEGHSYIIGVDWSGAGQDYTCFVVIDATDRRMAYIDRFSGASFAHQATRLKALIERYNPDMTYAELNAMGAPQVESLQREDVPIYGLTTTQASKNEWVNKLSLALERGDLHLLRDDTLISELLAYEATRLPGGMYRYSAPEGMHDDTVMALMLAWQAVADERPALLW